MVTPMKKTPSPYYYEIRPNKGHYAWTDDLRTLWRICDPCNTVVASVTVTATTRRRMTSWWNPSGYRVVTEHQVTIGLRIGYTGQEVLWHETWRGGLIENVREFIRRTQAGDTLYNALYEARARLRAAGLSEYLVYGTEHADNVWDRDAQGELVFDQMQALSNLYHKSLAHAVDILSPPAQ